MDPNADPDETYREWLQWLIRGDEEEAKESAQDLLDWIVGQGGVEPSWGERRVRDNFIEWCRYMRLNGAFDMTVSVTATRTERGR